MGLAHSQILPTTFSRPRVISEEFRRRQGVGPRPDIADDLWWAQNHFKVLAMTGSGPHQMLPRPPAGQGSFQSSSADGMGLAPHQILPMATRWPRIISEQFRRWHRVGPPLDTADDLLLAQNHLKKLCQWHGVGPPPLDAADDVQLAQNHFRDVPPMVWGWPSTRYCR
jgi:hypothetical protein